jgi:hypothetical protein
MNTILDVVKLCQHYCISFPHSTCLEHLLMRVLPLRRNQMELVPQSCDPDSGLAHGTNAPSVTNHMEKKNNITNRSTFDSLNTVTVSLSLAQQKHLWLRQEAPLWTNQVVIWDDL